MASPRPCEQGHCRDEPRRRGELPLGSPPGLRARREPRSRGDWEAGRGCRGAGLWGAVCWSSLPESSEGRSHPPDKDRDPRCRVPWKESGLPLDPPPSGPPRHRVEPCSCPRASTHLTHGPSPLRKLRLLRVRLGGKTRPGNSPHFRILARGHGGVPPPRSKGGSKGGPPRRPRAATHRRVPDALGRSQHRPPAGASGSLRSRGVFPHTWQEERVRRFSSECSFPGPTRPATDPAEVRECAARPATAAFVSSFVCGDTGHGQTQRPRAGLNLQQRDWSPKRHLLSAWPFQGAGPPGGSGPQGGLSALEGAGGHRPSCIKIRGTSQARFRRGPPCSLLPLAFERPCPPGSFLSQSRTFSLLTRRSARPALPHFPLNKTSSTRRISLLWVSDSQPGTIPSPSPGGHR